MCVFAGCVCLAGRVGESRHEPVWVLQARVKQSKVTFERGAPAVVMLFPAGGVAVTGHAGGAVGDWPRRLLIPDGKRPARAQSDLIRGRTLWGISDSKQCSQQLPVCTVPMLEWRVVTAQYDSS